MKIYYILFFTALLILAGCAQKADLPELMSALNTSVSDYSGTYKLESEMHSWAGHSGASYIGVDSEIFIEVKDNKIIDYSKKHKMGGYETEDYYRYLDKDLDLVCQKETISRADCDPVPMPKPSFGEPMTGSRITFDKNGQVLCKCNGQEISPAENLGCPCSEIVDTSNMELRYGWAFYKPEIKKGFCFYEAKHTETEEFWIFECASQNIELSPRVTDNQSPLKNVLCQRYGFSSCRCEFDPVETKDCTKEIPPSFDAATKQDIISYLSEINITAVEKDHTDDGICYSFFAQEYDHKFCFNGIKQLTYAQWGPNLRKERSTDVDTHIVRLV